MPPQSLFSRLPQCWKRYDAEDHFGQRFLAVADDSFARVHGSVKDIGDLLSVDRCPDRFLAYMSDDVGHVWRSDKDRDWNRGRIRDAIPRHAYKGSRESLADLIREHGGRTWSVVDMASRYEVWSRQGEFGAPNNMFFDADWFHPGVYVLTLDDRIEFEAFLEDFQKIKPRGQTWYFVILHEHYGSAQITWHQEVLVDVASMNAPSRIYGQDFFDYRSQPIIERLQMPVQWVGGRNRQSSIFGDEFLDYVPQRAAERQITPVVWFSSLTGSSRLYGEEFLDYKPQMACGREILSSRGPATQSGGYITLDRPVPLTWDFITIDMGSPENPLQGELAGLQVPAERIVED